MTTTQTLLKAKAIGSAAMAEGHTREPGKDKTLNALISQHKFYDCVDLMAAWLRGYDLTQSRLELDTWFTRMDKELYNN